MTKRDIADLLTIAHNYASQVFSGNCPETEPDYTTPNAIPSPSPPKTYNEDEEETETEPVNPPELSFTLADLSSYVLVLANSLRLLKMLVCKHTSLVSYGMFFICLYCIDKLTSVFRYT